MDATTKIYHRYEYLANIYASKLYNYELLGMERQDIVQELKLKVFTTIVSYGKRWKDYKETGRYKPIPLLYYLQRAINNKLKDMMRHITDQSKIRGISIQSTNFDYGNNFSNDYTIIDFKNKEVLVKGVDLLDGLDKYKSNIFCLYLKGFPIKTISKAFRKEDVSTVIREQVVKLQKQETILLEDTGSFQCSYSFEEN